MYIKLLHKPYVCYIEDAGSKETPDGEVKDEPKTDLNSIIQAAKDKVEGKKEEEKKEEPKKEEAKKEEKKAEKSEEADELTDEEVKRARELFKALKDPEKGTIVLRALAEQAGITKDSTKEEKKVVAKTIESVLMEHVGKEFPSLAAILAPALKEAIELVAEEKTKDLREREASRDKQERESAIDGAMNSAFGQFENFDDKIGAKVLELMDEFPPSSKVKMDIYFTRLTKMAAEDLNIKLISKGEKKSNVTDIEQRRERNRNDAAAQLASKSETKVTEVSQDKKMSIDEAIQAAVDKIEAGKK